MASITLTLSSGDVAVMGKQITFTAPCASEEFTGIIIDSVEYDLVSANGTSLAASSFDAGSMVSIILDVNNRKAYVQNADTNAYLEAQLASKAPAHTYGTEDIVEGSASSEPEGTLHFVIA